MIEFTIKTLDSNNHSFSVDDETTVQQLKEKVMEQMGIEIHQQRLIFCGRVLQDERKLSEYDVHGKVVHLVQRAPPSTETRGDRAAPTPSSSTSSTEPNNMQQQIRRLMALGAPPDFLLEQQQAMALPPTTARLEFIRRMIADIKTSLAILREHVDGQDSSSASRDAPVEPTENEPTTTATPREGDPLLDENGDEAPDPSNPSTNRAQYARRRAVRALRQRHSNRPRDLGQLLEELEGLQEQFSPYRITYIRMLRCANNPEPPQFTGEGRQNAQRTVDIVSDIMHSFAHAYHAVSDLNFQVGQRNPRLTSESTFIRHAMPMQAHVNLVQPNRRPAQQQQAQQPSSNGYAGNVSGSGASSAQTASGTQAAPHTVPSTVTSNNQDGLPDLSGRISVQPTINFSIEPDPITYQVEIETRVPIAIPLENSLFDGLSAALSQNQDQNLQGPQTQVGPEINQAGSANQAGQDGQPGLNNQASQTGQPGEGGQTGQAGQANRRQVLLDFENILRGLGPTGGLGGVEVLMSMEELPHGSALGVGTIYTGNNNAAAPAGTVGGVTTGSASDTATVSGPAAGSGGNNSGQPMMSEEGMYVPLPWGPPSADLLQNIFQAMVRHGLPEGVTVQFPGGHAHHFHHIPGDTVTVTPLQQFLQAQHAQLQQMIQTPHNPQGAQQQVSYNLQGAQQQAPQGQPQNTQAQQPAQGAQANQDQWNSNIRNAQPHVHLRRVATATRAQAVPLSNCIYDRFLYCDSAHARRRLQRRREQHQQHIAAQERLRAVRTAAQNIETLRERNINLTENNIQTMLQLLNSTPSQESWLNAIFVTVARQLYLSDPMQTFSGEPQLLPNEYAQLRTLLRSLMHSLMDRSELPDAENTYEAVSEYFVTRHADFINNMHRITPVRYEVDIYPTLRGFIRARLPAIIACIMSDVSGEMFSGRFYSVIARMFTDFCTLIRHCLEEGVEGLRVIFRLFMEVLVRNFDEPVRQLLVTLGQANLNGAINNMGNNVVQQYIVRRVETIPLPPGQPQAPIPMEVSLAPQAREEPMQTSRPTTPAENGLNSQSASPIPIAMDTMSLTSQASTSTVTSQASTSTMTSAPTTPVDTVASTHSSSPSPSSPSGANAITDKDNNTSTSTPTHNGDTDENLRLVPPLVIVEHWDEEWVPVFTHDQQAQRAEPQEPCSEAYLSGMPSRKRRRVRQMRPPTSLDGFMNESVREAADHERLNAVVDHSAVRRALREHMRSIARTRASNSEDYDPQHFASVARFLNPTRPNIPQPQDNDTPNKDEE